MNFLNLHVLFPLAAANPNRDDAGSPKSVRYGGQVRSRISSQAMTRAKRVAAELAADRTFRSVTIAERIAGRGAELLEQRGEQVDDAGRARLLATATKSVQLLTAKDREESVTRGEAPDTAAATSPNGATAGAAAAAAPKDTMIWLAEAEIEAAAIKLAGGAALTPDDLAGPRTSSLTIAAFGRMFANRPDLQGEAAVQRAHAITTHATANEVDYFTAVDDLRTANKGAGHLGLAELTGGIYYWHANIDIRQLLTTWTAAADPDAADRLRQLFLALFTALPRGKQSTTAHHTLPTVVLAVPAAMPVNLQAAFETPVVAHAGGGYRGPSINALFTEHALTSAALPSRFGAAKFAATTRIEADVHGDVQQAVSLEDLADWCTTEVLDQLAVAPRG